MDQKRLTFEDVPAAVAEILLELTALREEVQKLKLANNQKEWLSLKELCEYLPGNPVEDTIRQYVKNRKIPHIKLDKGIGFQRSEIDAWLVLKKRKTMEEIKSENPLLIFRQKKKAS